tara:strand:+ start:5118 stop:5306 length:189 start_codon:yes stop_codon:yes gene_type:complete
MLSSPSSFTYGVIVITLLFLCGECEGERGTYGGVFKCDLGGGDMEGVVGSKLICLRSMSLPL